MFPRTLLATVATFLLLSLGTTASAIDKDQIIDPGTPAQQDDQSNQAMSEIFSGQDASLGVMVTLLGYAVVIGALCIAVWYFFKRGGFRKSFSKGQGKLRVAETRMLGNRQFISVIEYEDQKILIGVGPGKIDYLTTLRGYGDSFPPIEPETKASEGGVE